jgi:PAS domain-containing protein
MGIGGVVLELFRAFSLRCEQIEEAIRLGDDQRVMALDRGLGPLVGAILACRAANLLEVYMQIQFVGYLISQDIDDGTGVTQHMAALSYLFDRYFGIHEMDWRASPPRDTPIHDPLPYIPETDNGNFLNAAILEGLQDRVAVLTRDYRYLYSNSANCAHLGRRPMELIGRHIVEFIGKERFEARAKPRLDACFSGLAVDYIYAPDRGEGVVRSVRCRMSPLRDVSGKAMIGALIVLQVVN